MGDNNSPFQGHPFNVALSIFNAAVRTPLNIAAAFWRPWFTEDGNQKCGPHRTQKAMRWKYLCRRPRIKSQQSPNQRQCRRKSLTAPSANAKHRSPQ